THERGGTVWPRGGWVEKGRGDKSPPGPRGNPLAAPEWPRPEEETGQRDRQEDVAAVQEEIDRALRQVGDITPVAGRVVQCGDVGHPPQEMSPPEPVPRAVRVPGLVTVPVVDAVHGHPAQGPPLAAQGAHVREDT